jgi:hypothetical protein
MGTSAPATRATEVATLKFGTSPEEQKEAGFIVGAMVEGHRDRMNGVPLYQDADGKDVYRILLGGFRWKKYAPSAYAAWDGPGRSWQVGRSVQPKGWSAVLHDDRPGSPHPLGEFKSMAAAMSKCTDEARRMPWVEGAPF